MEKFSWLSDHGARVLVDHLRDGIFVIEDGLLVYVNQQLADMLGYAAVEVVGLPFIELIATEEQSMVWERHRARLAGESVTEQYDLHLVSAQGKLIFCSLNVSLFKSAQGQMLTIGSVRDVTKQKSELAELETSKMELMSIFDQLPDVFYRTNMRGVITMISPSCYEVLGYRQYEMLGKFMSDFYNTPEERQKVVQAIIEGGGKATRVEAGLRHKDGSLVWISTNAFVRLDASSTPISIDGVARDISERKRMEDKLTSLTQVDALTGAYTRRYFIDKAEAIFRMKNRYPQPLTVMMLDLDHFKQINDQYGHQVGDLALIAFAQVCRREIRDSDILGRLGGEEFALVLPETALENALILAERICKATAKLEVPAAKQSVRFTVSIGLVAVGDEQTLDEVLRRADGAMYLAKERGRNQVCAVEG